MRILKFQLQWMNTWMNVCMNGEIICHICYVRIITCYVNRFYYKGRRCKWFNLNFRTWRRDLSQFQVQYFMLSLIYCCRENYFQFMVKAMQYSYLWSYWIPFISLLLISQGNIQNAICIIVFLIITRDWILKGLGPICSLF